MTHAHTSQPAPRGSLYADITARIAAELEEGRLPWVRPWRRSGEGVPLGMPANASTGRRYFGINVLILWEAVIGGSYPMQRWLTFKQAVVLGGCVRKGERGTTVFYADRFTPEKERSRAEQSGEDPRSIAFLKRFTVFNVTQCDGLPPELAAPPTPIGDHHIMPVVEEIISWSGADFRIGGDRAFYMPAHDFVQVPPPSAYFQPINWHRTALHELGHWTGAKHRLGRDHVRLKVPYFGPGAAGKWIDAATGEHGDLLDLIGACCRLTQFADVACEARRFLCDPASRPMPAEPSSDWTSNAARRLFEMARPIRETRGEAYLTARGIADSSTVPALRFHPTCFYRASEGAPRQERPALIAAVTDWAGTISVVHRTWLTLDDPGDISPVVQRRALGAVLGHGVRFGVERDVATVGRGSRRFYHHAP